MKAYKLTDQDPTFLNILGLIDSKSKQFCKIQNHSEEGSVSYPPNYF